MKRVGIECIGFGVGKIWSGLLKDHYAPIWEMLLEAMRTEVATGVAMDAAALSHAQFAFSAAWVRQTVRVKSARLFAPSPPDALRRQCPLLHRDPPVVSVLPRIRTAVPVDLSGDSMIAVSD